MLLGIHTSGYQLRYQQAQHTLSNRHFPQAEAPRTRVSGCLLVHDVVFGDCKVLMQGKKVGDERTAGPGCKLGRTAKKNHGGTYVST